MPTYEYQCAKCGGVFEKFQSMTEAALTVCPKDRCARSRWGKGQVKRAIGGGAGLIFKGTGFYITDHRSESYKAAAKKDSPASAPTSDGGKAGADKPAAKNTDSVAKPSKS
jgi:putative FmdB family regulatory protein